MTAPPSVVSDLDLIDTLVIGAGVLGLCVAVELTLRGHQVAVLDPGGGNASSVAAGMIAPALESAVDDVAPDRAALLRRAAELWPDFAAATGVELHDDGAVWSGAGADQIAERLSALGFDAARNGDRVEIRGERRVEAEPALAALAQILHRPLLQGSALRIEPVETGWRVVHSHGEIHARNLVLATGAAQAIDGLPAGVARRIADIQPIGGMTGKTAAGFDLGVIRGRGAYAATGPEGSVIGATMSFGERQPTAGGPEGLALLEALETFSGARVSPERVEWRAGVRGAMADGLPLAGAVETPGLFLALAPRRNGWLLGPLVGRVVADAVEGRAPSADAASLDPLRPM